MLFSAVVLHFQFFAQICLKNRNHVAEIRAYLGTTVSVTLISRGEAKFSMLLKPSLKFFWLEVITVVLIVYPIIWYWFCHGNLKTLSVSGSRIEYLCVPVLENCCLWFLTQIFNQSNQHKRWIMTLKASQAGYYWYRSFRVKMMKS